MKVFKSHSNPNSPFQLSWKFFELLIVIGAFAVGALIWFIPNWAESEQMHRLEDAVNERKERRIAIEQRQAEILEERERLGLVYFGPGAVPIIDEDGESTPPPAPTDD